MRVSEKTSENSEQLGRQARPGFEPGTSRLPVLSITTPPLVGLPERKKFYDLDPYWCLSHANNSDQCVCHWSIFRRMFQTDVLKILALSQQHITYFIFLSITLHSELEDPS